MEMWDKLWVSCYLNVPEYTSHHYDQANIYQEIGLQYPVGKSRSRQKENEKNNQKIKHSAEQKIMDLLFWK